MGDVSRGHLFDMRMDDTEDPWGTAMQHSFAIAEALTYLGWEHYVPAETEFRCSPLGPALDREPDQYPDCLYAADLQSGVMTADEANRTLKVLHRYLRLLKYAGMDY